MANGPQQMQIYQTHYEGYVIYNSFNQSYNQQLLYLIQQVSLLAHLSLVSVGLINTVTEP